MKKLICCLLASLFIISGSCAAETRTYLQVIGETDWADAQAYKLNVRDWALEYAGQDAAALEKSMNDRAESEGRPRNIRVETGVFPCSAGDFPVVRVRIGRAEGRNWWGLLYPEQAGCGEDVIYYSAVVDWLLSIFGIE